jgi:GNAT superfamily N-acetyltransferase
MTGPPRPARADESADVADLYLRARHAAVPAVPPLVHDDHDVRHWFATVVMPEREVWVVDGPEDVGLVGLLVLDGDWVDQLYVHPAWTGRGIGRSLLDAAKRLRPDGLQLWAFQSNTGARRFYERHGFAAAETTDGDNEEGEPDVRYVWPTPSA